jgi:hypothetical protein
MSAASPWKGRHVRPLPGRRLQGHSTLETKGIVNAFGSRKIEASSSGLLNKGRVQPSLYDSFSQNRSTPRRHATMTFTPEGPRDLTSDPPYGENRYP